MDATSFHVSGSFLYINNENYGPSNFMNKFEFFWGSRDGTNCNLYIPKPITLKKCYYIGAKIWDDLSSNLTSDAKIFAIIYRTRILDSIIQIKIYHVNNAFSYFYKPIDASPPCA